MEREILEGVFTRDEFRVEDTTDGTTVFIFTLGPRTGDDASQRPRVWAEIGVVMGPLYPDVSPAITLTKCRGLVEADAAKVLCAANAAAADSIGMECCYAVADAVLDALSHVNDSAIECCICLAAVLPEELSCAYTGSCFHSFHGDCIFGWVRTCRTSIEAERSSQETPIHRHLSACRGDVGNKVKFANDVSDQLESVKNDIAATQAEVESYKLSLAVADDSIVAAAASRLKELEKVLSALLLSRDSLKAKLRSARQKVEEAEARLGRESAKLLALTASSKPMLIPCPVCRLPLPWDPPQEAGYGLWLAAQVDGAPSPPTDSTNLLEALDADTRAYVLRFREHVAAVTAAQREAGGQIDPAGTPSLVVGAPPPPPPTVDPPPTMDDH